MSDENLQAGDILFFKVIILVLKVQIYYFFILFLDNFYTYNI
jgi:hypothetical protein